VYDYGHYGTLLLNNVKQAWQKSTAQERMDVLLLDSAIFMHPTTWKASGHVDGFNDPQVDCRKCKSRFRADHMLEEFDINADKQPLEFINAELDKLRAEKKLVCANCKSADLTEAKVFSLMLCIFALKHAVVFILSIRTLLILFIQSFRLVLLRLVRHFVMRS
jgi:glycyl-tRNA synthetase